MKYLLIIIMFLFGCTSAPEIIREPIEVKIPIEVQCSATAPDFYQTLADGMPKNVNRREWLKQALIDRENLIGYSLLADAYIQTCKAKK